MFDLASMLSPQAQNTTGDGQPATQKDSWDSFLANPATRAALLNFGLQSLAGGWGSPGQNIAQAIGSGMEAGAQVGSNQEAERQKQEALATDERRFQAKQANEAADRTNRMDIAKLYANNRTDVAQIRARGGPQNVIEQRAWNTSYQTAYKSLKQSQLLNPSLTDDQIEQQAIDAANAGLEGYRQQFGMPGGGTPGGDYNGGLGPQGGDLGGPNGGAGAGGTMPPAGGAPAVSTQTNRPLSTGRDKNGKPWGAFQQPDGSIKWQPM